MKKIILLAVLLVLLSPAAVSAVGWKDSVGSLGKSIGSVGFESDITNPIAAIIQSALALTGMIFLLLTVYAGFLWMTAAGNETKVESAQKIVTAAIIGLVIVSSAYTITYFVTKNLGASGGGAGAGTNDGSCPGSCIADGDPCPGGTIIKGFSSCVCCVQDKNPGTWSAGNSDIYLGNPTSQ